MRAVAAAIALALAFLCVYLLTDQSSTSAARIQELEQQVAVLKAELAESRDRSVGTEGVNPLQVSPAQNERAVGTPENFGQVQELAALVQRFEQTARDLNDRITRSKLNLPTQQEFQVQLEKARKELDRTREAVRRKTAVVRNIAASLNVRLGDDSLLSPGVSPVLDANPAFVAARSAAIAERNVLNGIEQRYSELRFSMALEAAPVKLAP